MLVLRVSSVLALSALALAVACGGGEEEAAPPELTTTGASGGTTSGDTTSSTSSGGSSGASSGASSGDGGTSGTPGTGCGGTQADPSGAALVEADIDTLPFGKPTGAGRAEVVDAILRTCELFTPTNAGFTKKHCYAHLVSAILKESSYDANLTEVDTYGKRAIGAQKANDPIVGLLQIRFSATVRDYAGLGHLDKLSCIGCDMPKELVDKKEESNDSAFWAVTGPTKYMSLMTKRACNVAFGAWYYYVNATGNGNASKTTYPFQYCGNVTPTPATLVTGLRSHLMGSDIGRGAITTMAGVNALQNTDGTSFEYVTQIKQRFDGAIGAVNGTHPFFVLLQPEKAKYCR
jgi:hypothetical protein